MSDVDQLRISDWILTWDLNAEHRTGTTGDQKTSQWLFEEIVKLGAEPVIEEFGFRRRTPTNCRIESEDFTLDGVPLFDCTETSPDGVSTNLSNSPDRDSIYVLECGPGENRHLNAARQDNAVAGVVVVSKGQVSGLSLINADAFDSPFGPPVLQISTDDGDVLAAASQANASAALTVQFETSSTTASNVSTTIRGSAENLAPVVVMTPKSAWWTCTAERVGGLVAWLECIRYFTTHPPKRTVIFTANTGHELGHLGLEHFLEVRPELGAGAHIWVHFGANFAAKDCSIRLQGSNQELIKLVTDQLSSVNESEFTVVAPGTRPGGEARNIFDCGGRYVSILGSNRLFHHPDDRMSSNIDLLRLMRLTDACVKVVAHLAHA